MITETESVSEIAPKLSTTITEQKEKCNSLQVLQRDRRKVNSVGELRPLALKGQKEKH